MSEANAFELDARRLRKVLNFHWRACVLRNAPKVERVERLALAGFFEHFGGEFEHFHFVLLDLQVVKLLAEHFQADGRVGLGQD